MEEGRTDAGLVVSTRALVTLGVQVVDVQTVDDLTSLHHLRR